jgi:3-oxoacyl-(acyl-carrier-protein) synthase
MKRRRVKITGIGPVTPAGIGKDEFWKGILEPVSRVRPYKALSEEYGPLVAAYINKFDVHDYVEQNGFLKGCARHTLFAVAGTMLAVQDAGIPREALRTMECAIMVGTTLMDFGGICDTIDAVHRLGPRAAKGRVVYSSNTASVAGILNQVFGVTARTMALQSSCCSGMDAIGFAAELVARGEVDLALCGGTEAPLHRCPLLELRASGLTPATTEMPERLSRPFDLWRTTGVVSEGACMFVLEPEESPRVGYSYISGYAFANDAPNDLCGGITEASRLAMAEARIRPAQIEVINAWGPGHKLIDAGEARAMAAVFQSMLSDLPTVSIKGAIGAPFGAAPAIQVATAALAQRFSILPPTVNWEYPDPQCPLNLSNCPRAIAHRRTLINAHGLAGVNACMVLERC